MTKGEQQHESMPHVAPASAPALCLCPPNPIPILVPAQVDCYTVSLLPIKAAIDEHMKKLQEALVASLRRKVHPLSHILYSQFDVGPVFMRDSFLGRVPSLHFQMAQSLREENVAQAFSCNLCVASP